MNFRLGDRVKILENKFLGKFDIGEEVTVSETFANCCDVTDGKNTWCYSNEELQLLKHPSSDEITQKMEEIVTMKSKKVSSKKSAKSSGTKHDNEKPDMSLLSSVALIEMSKVMTFGKKKYSANNWRSGIEWSRVIAAAFRHLTAYNGGEDKDPETGITHLAHCACDLMFLMEYEKTHKELDNRYKRKDK